jgi:hypothetical protein
MVMVTISELGINDKNAVVTIEMTKDRTTERYLG